MIPGIIAAQTLYCMATLAKVWIGLWHSRVPAIKYNPHQATNGWPIARHVARNESHLTLKFPGQTPYQKRMFAYIGGHGGPRLTGAHVKFSIKSGLLLLPRGQENIEIVPRIPSPQHRGPITFLDRSATQSPKARRLRTLE